MWVLPSAPFCWQICIPDTVTLWHWCSWHQPSEQICRVISWYRNVEKLVRNKSTLCLTCSLHGHPRTDREAPLGKSQSWVLPGIWLLLDDFCLYWAWKTVTTNKNKSNHKCTWTLDVSGNDVCHLGTDSTTFYMTVPQEGKQDSAFHMLKMWQGGDKPVVWTKCYMSTEVGGGSGKASRRTYHRTGSQRPVFSGQ